MLSFFYLPLLLLAPLFVSADSQSPGKSHGKWYYPWNPVQWTSTMRNVPFDTTIELSWRGGSGNGYEVYYIPQWDNQETFKSIDIATTTKTSVKWHTPKQDSYPAGTTFILAVKDVTAGHGSEWYDLTGQVGFGNR